MFHVLNLNIFYYNAKFVLLPELIKGFRLCENIYINTHTHTHTHTVTASTLK